MPRPDLNLTDAFHAALPDALRAFRTNDPEKIVRVPAVSRDVGDLIVRNDGDELCVGIGAIDHRHFEAPLAAGASEQDRQREVALEAAEWVRDVLAERVRFRVELAAGRVIAGSSWHVDHRDGGPLLALTEEVREYTWSGEKFRGGRAPE